MVFAKLKRHLSLIYKKSRRLYKKVERDDGKTPIQKIKELHVSEVTKENYLREWSLYLAWLRKHNLSPEVESANSYLGSLEKKASTLRTKQGLLQNILQIVVDPTIKLNQVKRRITFTPKYALTDKELEAYLKEQKRLNKENYLIQKLLATYGLRINSAAAIKIKHLEYLSSNTSFIHLPESKVGRQRIETIEDEFGEELEGFLGRGYDQEDYVFYKEGKNRTMRQRSYDMMVRINKCIRSSKVLQMNENYKYSSHMFRKTVAWNTFHQGIENLKAKARKRIGQAPGSTAINSYIFELP